MITHPPARRRLWARSGPQSPVLQGPILPPAPPLPWSLRGENHPLPCKCGNEAPKRKERRRLPRELKHQALHSGPTHSLQGQGDPRGLSSLRSGQQALPGPLRAV